MLFSQSSHTPPMDIICEYLTTYQFAEVEAFTQSAALYTALTSARMAAFLKNEPEKKIEKINQYRTELDKAETFLNQQSLSNHQKEIVQAAVKEIKVELDEKLLYFKNMTP